MLQTADSMYPDRDGASLYESRFAPLLLRGSLGILDVAAVSNHEGVVAATNAIVINRKNKQKTNGKLCYAKLRRKT